MPRKTQIRVEMLDHRSVLKGHGFSRAANSRNMKPALAAEGSFWLLRNSFRSLFSPDGSSHT
jgi:hypothetical protein